MEPDGPAARAGVEVGDLVALVAGNLVQSVDDIYRAMSKPEGGAKKNPFPVRTTPVHCDQMDVRITARQGGWAAALRLTFWENVAAAVPGYCEA